MSHQEEKHDCLPHSSSTVVFPCSSTGAGSSFSYFPQKSKDTDPLCIIRSLSDHADGLRRLRVPWFVGNGKKNQSSCDENHTKY